MQNIFPFVYDKLWDGIASEDQGIFKIEFKRKCEQLTEKEFKKWMSKDHSFFNIIHMTSAERFHKFQNNLRPKCDTTYRNLVVDSSTYVPMVEFNQLFTTMPHMLDIMSAFLYHKHMQMKEETEYALVALKHKIPFYYRGSSVRTYTYTEKKYRTRVSHTLSFQVTRWYNNAIEDVTIDMNKMFSASNSKHKDLKIPLHVGCAIKVLDYISIPLDVILLCMRYER